MSQVRSRLGMAALLPCLALLLPGTLVPLLAQDPSDTHGVVQPPPPAQGAQKPFLGIQVDQAPGFDTGVPVSTVLPNCTAALMGMQNGDTIQLINKTPIATMDDLQKAMGGLKLGEAIAIDVLRKGEKVSLSGVMLAKPPPPLSLQMRIKALEEEVERLKKRADHPPDLAETLDNLVKELNDLQRDLPRASEAFRKLYPDGEFSIKMEIKITSDKNAKDPVTLGNGVDSSQGGAAEAAGGPGSCTCAPAPGPAPVAQPPAAPAPPAHAP